MKQKIIPPTEAENREIMAGIAADPDNPEWRDEEIYHARPAQEVLPEMFGKEIAAELLQPKKSGRPCAE